MKLQFAHIIEGTVVLVALYWIVKNPYAFGDVIKSGAEVTVGSARALWGGGYNTGTGR